MDVTNLETRLSNIENELKEIKELLVNINSQTSTMKNHVDFVESTYETIEKPFHNLMDLVTYYSGNSTIKYEE